MESGNFGIIVSGGPAPGINSVIASVVIQAAREGCRTKGFQRGFAGIIEDGQDCVCDLDIAQVSPIANTGGSILGTSRINPFATAEGEKKLKSLLDANSIDKLVVIGGEGSAFLSLTTAKKFPTIRVAHIPKTIDNDLILPNKHPSFGFETARFAGTRILNTIIAEAKTTTRWFIVRTMGRKAGFLAMGMGLSSGATLSIIAEQFSDRSKLHPNDIANIIVSSIKNRIANGKNYGTAVISEGIIDLFDPAEVDELKDSPRDDMGRLRFAEIDLEIIIAKAVRRQLEEEGIKMRISTNSIGYELRCREPVPFDIEYTRLLGFGAVKYLLEGQEGIMVVRDFDNLAYVPLESMVNQSTGVLKTRKVDLNSDIYKVASSFMIR